MADEPKIVKESDPAKLIPCGSHAIGHCCACYEKSIAFDREERERVERHENMVRAEAILELDAGRCSQELRDAAEAVIMQELKAKIGAPLAVPKF